MHVSFRHKQQAWSAEVRREGEHFRVALADGEVREVKVDAIGDGVLRLAVNGQSYRVAIARHGRQRFVAVGGEVYELTPESAAQGGHAVGDIASPEVVAPMPGKILQVLVKAGDRVEAGSGLVILEAMKMETRLSAEAAGSVAEVRVGAGDTVDGGQVLVVLQLDET